LNLSSCEKTWFQAFAFTNGSHLAPLRGGKLAQITWRSNRGFYYDPKTLEQIGKFRTPLEDGWGLANDTASDMMIISDASHNLHFVDGGGGGGESGGEGGGEGLEGEGLEGGGEGLGEGSGSGSEGGGAASSTTPTTLTLSRSTAVTDHGKTIRFTNELEAVRGEVGAAHVDP
jgi:glutamine cyclotransferase